MRFFTRKTWYSSHGSLGLFGLAGGTFKCSNGKTTERWAIHFFPQKPKDGWQWGYEEDWYDGPIPSFSLGPLFLIAW